jgi:hypothetical protein
MKKIFTVVLLAFTINTGLLQAQSQRPTWIAGPRLGLNISNISGDYADEFSIRPGVIAGLFTEYKTGDRVGFFLDLLYSMKGANINTDASALNEGRYKLTYLDIPVALTFYPVEKFGLYAGPQISLLIDSSLKTGDSEDDRDDTIEANDYGVVGGFRYIATPRLHFDLRFYHSLSDLSTVNLFEEGDFDSGEIDPTLNTDDRSLAGSLTISYAIFVRQ